MTTLKLTKCYPNPPTKSPPVYMLAHLGARKSAQVQRAVQRALSVAAQKCEGSRLRALAALAVGDARLRERTLRRPRPGVGVVGVQR